MTYVVLLPNPSASINKLFFLPIFDRSIIVEHAARWHVNQKDEP